MGRMSLCRGRGKDRPSPKKGGGASTPRTPGRGSPGDGAAAAASGPSLSDVLPPELVGKVADFLLGGVDGGARDRFGGGALRLRSLRAVSKALKRAASAHVVSVRVGDFERVSLASTRRSLLAFAAGCSRLRCLSLRNMDALCDDELRAIAPAGRTLRILNVGGCVRLGDGAAASLAQFPRLESLNVAMTAISGHALALALRAMPRLADLSLYGKRDLVAGEDGDRAGLPTLRALLDAAPSIRSVNARETGVGERAASMAVRAARPAATWRDTVVLTGDRPATAGPSVYCSPPAALDAPPRVRRVRAPSDS